ncbi:MAG: hypothetical protein ACKO51_03495, partial [Alphaproteobacteria bacterium]
MRLAGALLLLWFAFGVPAMAQQAPTVGFRVGNHPTYGRVVMDWPEAVTYRAEEAGNRLTLRFDAPARYDLSGALRLPKNVESLSAIDGGIVLQAPPGTRFRHYRLGNRVVIDVLDGAEASEATPPVGTASPPAAPARAAGTQPAPAAPAPPAQAGVTPPAAAPRPAAAPPATPAARPPPTAPPPREAAPPTSQAATASAPAPSAADVSRPGPGANTATTPMVAQPPSPVTPVVTPAPPAADPAPAPVQAQPAPAARPLVVVPPRRTTPVGLLAEGRAISLDLGAETGAAIFRHGDWVIAVFDRPEVLDLSQLQGSEIFRNMEARQTGDATILQMRMAQPG